MEDLGFFNEREAECFEREDTLSQSDLEKLNVDENMPEMERAEKLLKTGLDKQKISILNSLPKILASNNSKTNLSIILDCMKGVWQKYESEMNADVAVLLELFKGLASLACATVDGKVLSYPTVTFHDEYAHQLETCWTEKKNAVFLLSDEQVTKLLVPFALDIIAEIQQKDFAEEASSVVIALLPRIGTALKKTQILRVAIEKGDVSQTPGSRLICCFILGAVTALNLLSAPDIEGLYFQKMMSLCQDTDAEVRKCMCIQLDGLARAVGEEHACKELLPELLELLNDEEEQVKQIAFLALLSLFDFFPARDRTKQIIPEFIGIAESLPDYLVPLLAEQYGQLVTKLATLNHVGNDTGQVFLQGYSKLCSHEEQEIRQYCAYNFPAIVKAFGSTYISTLMDDLLAKLASDPSEEVRHHIAAGIHEVALLLGQHRAMRYLKVLVLSLMNDESPVVQGMAISRVPQLLPAMINPSDEDQKWSSMLEYTLVVGKDGQVVRRARVKSFDLVNKIIRVPGKDTGRTGTMNMSGGLGGMSGGTNSMALAMGIGSKSDQSKMKATAPKTSNKPAPPITTLPNCATARPGHAKMPQAAKVANSTGKIITPGGKSNSGPTRSGTGLPKETSVITKIPIIRPSAPAKRETSPSSSTKPSSATLVLAPAPSSRLGTIDNGALRPQKASGIPGTPKR
ncbi:hypothetical protein PPTG_22648 [Phytophthora nicotianae INRA-310]|uniref:TOG domain-containing protein n=1 Tax=Phytophthora nicotianae (strain INRA-310) TaxID=761204 RepID=W2QFM2_PHYN3|nr:hypothetical protein PPTG_22648 [Phytophthora nicotianae INRA-310]ETN11085.1 hypothetical protein PPTG_22648 [Phytophthora nicotianae INRA-310]